MLVGNKNNTNQLINSSEVLNCGGHKYREITDYTALKCVKKFLEIPTPYLMAFDNNDIGVNVILVLSRNRAVYISDNLFALDMTGSHYKWILNCRILRKQPISHGLNYCNKILKNFSGKKVEKQILQKKYDKIIKEISAFNKLQVL